MQDEAGFDPFLLFDIPVLPQDISSDACRSFDFLLNFTRGSSLKKIFSYNAGASPNHQQMFEVARGKILWNLT